MLADCAEAGPCFSHAVACAEDGSMTIEDCQAALPFCKPCFPNSRCGGLTVDDKPEEDPVVEEPEEDPVFEEPEETPDVETSVAEAESGAWDGKSSVLPTILASVAVGLSWCFMVVYY